MFKYPIAALAMLTCFPAFAADAAFVAVGYGGRRLVSSDGVKWQIAAEWKVNGGDDGTNLIGVLLAGGKFVAVGGGGGGLSGDGHILVSRDGRDWKSVQTFKNRALPIMHGGGRFVVGAPLRRFWYSADGEAWKQGAAIADPTFTHFRHGAYGNGAFVAVGNGRNKAGKEIHWAVVTPDGEKITHEAGDLPPVRGLAFGAGRFVVVGPGGLRLSSKDGKTWEHKHTEAGNDLTRVIWTGKEFFASGAKPCTSPDGVTWKAWPARLPCEVMCVADGVWVGTSWPGQMWHSAGGQKWIRCEKLTPNGINAAAYRPARR